MHTSTQTCLSASRPNCADIRSSDLKYVIIFSRGTTLNGPNLNWAMSLSTRFTSNESSVRSRLFEPMVQETREHRDANETVPSKSFLPTP